MTFLSRRVAIWRPGSVAALRCAVLLSGALLAAAATAQPAKTGTSFRADADMQKVLDALAALGPKPIETLEPAEARKQPNPADAVMAVLNLLAAALKKAGVKVDHLINEGVTHEFFGMAAVVAKAREAQAHAGRQLKQSLATAAASR